MASRAPRAQGRDKFIDGAEGLERVGQQLVATGTARLPLLETLHVEKGPQLGVVVTHPQKQLCKACDLRGRGTIQYRKIAVVVGAGLREHAGGTGGQASLLDEGSVICVDHARGGRVTGEHGLGGLTLPANVITMLADQQVVALDLKVTPGFQAGRAQMN